MPNYNSNIWKMYLFTFLMSLFFIGGVLIPFFTEWGKINFFQIMLLQAIFVVTIFIFEAPTGAFADRFGRKVSLALAAIFGILGVLIYSSYPNFYVFILAEILGAVGFAFVSGADEALTYDSLKATKSEDKSKKIFARISTARLTAVMISAPLGGVVAHFFGLRYVMLLMAVPTFLALLISFTLQEPPIIKKVKVNYVSTLKDGLLYFKNHKILRTLAFDSIAVSTLSFFIIWLYQPKLMALNIPIAYFGVIHFLLTGAEILVMNNFKFFESLFGMKGNLVFSAVLPGTFFILLGLTNFFPLVVLSILVVAGFGLTRDLLFKTYYNKYIESHNRATVISSISMLERGVRGVLYPLVGLMVSWSLTYSFVIIGILLITSTIVSGVKEEHLVD